MVTLKEIAQKLNFSVSSVSAVLNKRSYCYVSKKNKKLIEDTARLMGYVPNKLACGMLGMPTQTIGIVGSLYNIPIHGKLLQCISEYLSEKNYSVILADAFKKVNLKKSLNELIARKVDGIIIANSYSDEELSVIFQAKIPHVFVINGQRRNTITYNRQAGMFKMAEHFILQHQAKKPVMLCAVPFSEDVKYAGYTAAMQKYNLEVLPRRVFPEADNYKACQKVCRELLADKIDAVLCHNDFMAIQVINTFNAMGVKIPDEIKISGFDGLDFMQEITFPSLTSVRSPVEATAICAGDALLDIIGGNTTGFDPILIEPTLQIGGSCGC